VANVAEMFAILRVDSAQVKKDVQEGLTGVDGAKAGEATGSSFGSGFQSKAGQTFTKVVGDLAKVGVATFAVIGVASIKMAADFQTGLTSLVTGAGESEKNLKMVGDGILAIAVSTGTTTAELISGMFMIESAGFHGAAGLLVLTAAAQGAKIGGASLADTADALTTVMKDYGPAVGTATQAMDGLDAIVSNGKTHLEDLATSMSKVLPTAAALHVSFADVGGAMATMTGEGVSARLAATGINATMIAMASPSAVAIAAMKAVGVSSSQVATTLTHQGLIAALDLVYKGALRAGPEGSAAFVAAMDHMLGGTNGLKVGLDLTGQHMGTLVSNTNAVAAATRSAGKDVTGWADVQKDANFQLDVLKERVEVAAIEIGQHLLPAVSAVLGWLERSGAIIPVIIGVLGVLAAAMVTQAVLWFTLPDKAGTAMIKMVVQVISWAAAQTASLLETAALWVMYTFSVESAGLATAIATGGIILIIAALAVAAYELYDHWNTVWAFIKHAAEDVFDWLKSNWPYILGILLGPIGLAAAAIYKNWDEIKKIFSGALDWIEGIFGGLGRWVTGVFADLADPVGKAFDAVKSVITGGFDSWWKTNGDAVEQVWHELWDVISGIFRDVWDPIVSQAKADWAFLVGVFDAGAALLTAAWKLLWGVVTTLFTAWWAVVTAIVKAAWAAVTIVFTTAMAVLTALWRVGWTMISGIFTIVWAAITLAWKAGWAVFMAVVTVAWAQIKMILTIAWDTITDIFTTFLDLVTGRWGAAWTEVQTWATQVWNAIKSFLDTVWGAIVDAVTAVFITPFKTLLHDLETWVTTDFLAPIKTLFTVTLPGIWDSAISATMTRFVTPLKNDLLAVWTWIQNSIGAPLKAFFTTTVQSWFGTAVTNIGNLWNTVEQIIRKPVAWVVDNVLDGLITVFDTITNAVGLGKPIGQVHPFGLAAGGRIPGYGGGDRHLVLAEAGEAVVSKETTAAHAAELASWGVPGFQLGGIISGLGHDISAAAGVVGNAAGAGLDWAGHIVGKAVDVAKVIADLTTGNVTAATNAFTALIGGTGTGGAVATLGKTLLAVPVKLVSDAVTWLMNEISSLGSASAGGSGGDIVSYAQQFLGKIPYTWGGTSLTGDDCSGFTQAVYHHFGYNAPRTSEEQGAWVKQGSPVAGGLAFFNSPAGGPPPGHVGIVTSATHMISQAGPEGVLGPTVGTIAGAMYTGVPPGGFVPVKAKGTTAGTMTATAISALWTSLGGAASAAGNMALIAMAESGDDPSIIQQGVAAGVTGYGLYQITPTSGITQNGAYGNLLNASNNTRAAIDLYNASGYSPWGSDPVGQRLSSNAVGGQITEPMIALGLRSGSLSTFGEAGVETVTPGGQQAGDGQAALIAEVRKLAAALDQVPARTAAGVAAAVTGPQHLQAQLARTGARGR
jgi:TP901 family phage tail tape measure protein